MAGYLQPELIDQIRDANDIVDLISEYLPLKKKGKNFLGLCPFHAEKDPSFTVTPEKQIFYCFGCGEGGNAIHFLMKHQKLSFPEAVKLLAEKAKIPLPKDGFDEKRGRHLDQLYYANQVANEYFVKNLYRETPGKGARTYLKKRGFDSDTLKAFSLGFAPEEWEGLIRFAQAKGTESEVLNQAGLAVPRPETSGFYDRFRNRITFPIFNLSGKIVGFGGRVLSDKDEPKYLNSPETPIYQKGKILYGLNLTKDQIRQTGSAILVEGYVDLITLFQAGIKNVVASSGTAFTQDQARLLSRYAEKVFLFFDADSAGQSATFRSVDLLFSEGLEVFVVSLEQGQDPDSFVQKFGKEAAIQRIQQARTFIDFKYQSLGKDFGELSMKEQEKVILDLTETAKRITSEIRRNLFVKKIAQTFRIDETPIFRLIGKRKPSTIGGLRTDARASVQSTNGGLGMGVGFRGEEKIERGILRLLMDDQKLLKMTAGKLEPQDFSTAEYRELFQMILSERKATPAVLLDKTENEKTKELIAQIASIDLGPAEPSVLLADHLMALDRMKLERRKKALKDQIQRALQEGDRETADRLTKEFQVLKKP
ncbi:MAG: DNA primase [Candidatus Zixiibacteriota bacterium]